MVTRVQKWGNSQGVRLSREILADADIEVGDPVDVQVRDGALLVVPVRRVRGRLNLAELVDRIEPGHRTEAVDWGPAVGNEVW